NLLWICMNDVIIGVALGSLIRDNRSLFLTVTETFVRTYVLGYLRDLLQWLSSWPMGIKLNDEVADVICRAFLGLSNLWEHAVCLEPMLAHLPIACIGLTGVLGASTLIGLVADLLSVLTLPFFACYVVAAFTFRQSFSMLHALFDVFRGRKFNPLRNRTEPATYEVDELLLGTILFVMLSAIFPTIMAFYFAFASSRLLILSSQALLITAVEALDAFPLFLLLLRFKSPHRLPGWSFLFLHSTPIGAVT
ncbi:Gpi1-domain-containing protein, partial [Rhodotorula sp. JG-1b]